jgi:hypothetical protein
MRGDQLKRSVASVSFGHDLNMEIFLNQLSQTLTKDRVIVGYQHTYFTRHERAREAEV